MIAKVATLTEPYNLFGAPLHPLSMEAATKLCVDAVANRRHLLIGVVNAAKLVNLQTDRALRESLLACDVVLPDGMAVVWASRLLGYTVPERVTGIDLFIELLNQADQAQSSVFLLGATDAVVGQAVCVIRERYPRIRIVGSHNGYFDPYEADEVARQVKDAGPDYLFVGMPTPRKELFLAEWSHRLGVPVCHGVGGSFDVLAGVVKRAPDAWQRLGLEWFYRTLQEPLRLGPRYLSTNTAFIRLLVGEWVRRLFR